MSQPSLNKGIAIDSFHLAPKRLINQGKEVKKWQTL